MILLLACTVWLGVAHDGDKWSSPVIDQHHLVLDPLDVGMEKRVRLIALPKNFLFLSSFWTIPDWGGWSLTSISSGSFDCSSCDLGILTSHHSSALTLPWHCAFWRGFQMRPSPPILQYLRPKCLLSRFTPRTIYNRGIYLAKLLS